MFLRTQKIKKKHLPQKQLLRWTFEKCKKTLYPFLHVILLNLLLRRIFCKNMHKRNIMHIYT